MSDFNNLPVTFRQTFSYLFQSIKLVGVDIFYEKSSGILKRNAILLFLLCLLIPLLIGQVAYICFGNADLIQMIVALSSFLTSLQGFIKIVVIAFKKDQIRELILEIAELWPTDPETEEHKIMTTFTKKMNKTYYYFMNYAFTCSMLYAVLPYLTFYMKSTTAEKKYMYLLEIWYPWSINTDLKYYITYILQAIPTTWINALFYAQCDTLVVVLTFNMSLLFRILQKRLESNTATKLKQHNSETQRNLNFSKLKEIVATHQKLIGLSDRICELFGVLIFVHIAMSSLMICCYAFLTLSGSHKLKTFLAAIGITVDVFYNALPGQFLQDMSQGVADAAFKSSWYVQEDELKKTILLIIRRAQRPCQLSGLGFCTMNLVTFGTIIKNSWSCLALVNHLYHGKT